LSGKHHHLRGYFYIAAATFCWGVAASLGRAAFTGRLLPGGESLPPIDALLLSQTRTSFTFLILLPLMLLRRGAGSLRIGGREFGLIVVYGIIGQAATNYFYYTAIERTNVATAIIIQYTAPVWVLLYLVARGRQKANGRKLTAVVLAVTGSALVIDIFRNGFALDGYGLIAAFLSALTFAFSNLWGHFLLQSRDRWTVLLYTTFTAALFWMMVNPPTRVLALHLTAVQWLFLFVFSIVSVLLPLTFYYAGLQLLEPMNAVVASCLEPVFAIAIAAAALGETMNAVQLSGIVLVISAIVLIQAPEQNERRQIPPLEPMD
jgi:drug/metabolite transporter (DMT)-like permease